MRLIPDWRKAWKFYSIRFLALGLTVQGALTTAPAAVTAHVPEWVLASLSTFAFLCLIAAGVGRIVKQEKLDEPDPEGP